MTGPRGGVIGVKREQALESLITQMPVRFSTSDDDPWVMGVLVRCSKPLAADSTPASAAKAESCPAFIATSSSAQARWLINVSIASPSSRPSATSLGETPRRFMPVSTITSHGRPAPVSSQPPGNLMPPAAQHGPGRQCQGSCHVVFAGPVQHREQA